VKKKLITIITTTINVRRLWVKRYALSLMFKNVQGGCVFDVSWPFATTQDKSTDIATDALCEFGRTSHDNRWNYVVHSDNNTRCGSGQLLIGHPRRAHARCRSPSSSARVSSQCDKARTCRCRGANGKGSRCQSRL